MDYYWVFQMFIIPILSLTAENWRINQQPAGDQSRGVKSSTLAPQKRHFSAIYALFFHTVGV